MREILFRAKAQGKGGKWVEGALINVDGYTCILERTNPGEYDYPYLDGDIGVIDGCACPIVPETVGQYIGRKDKNCKYIFEGDVVRYGKTHVGVINYNDCCFCVKLIEKGWNNKNNPAMDIVENEYPNDIEVIGNIHDNPELIGEHKDTIADYQ